MALEYDVTIIQNDSGEFVTGSTRDYLQLRFSPTYQVIFRDDADPTFTGENISPFFVLERPEIPKVNGSVYYDPEQNRVYPYVVCRSKRAIRDPGNRARWTVPVVFDSGDSPDSPGQTPPADLTDLTPQVVVTLGEQNWVPANDKLGSPIVLPTGNQFPTPAIERLATQRVQISQYEPSITYDTMESRKFLVNENSYRNKDRYKWQIQEVEGTEVTVQLQAGPVQAALVTYTLESNSAPNGWMEDRAMIDTHYLKNGADFDSKTPFTDKDYQTYTNGFVDAVDGTALPDQVNGPMQYDQWELYDTSDFSFLQA